MCGRSRRSSSSSGGTTRSHSSSIPSVCSVRLELTRLTGVPARNFSYTLGELWVFDNNVPLSVIGVQRGDGRSVAMASSGGWLVDCQFPLDSQKAEPSRTATLIW